MKCHVVIVPKATQNSCKYGRYFTIHSGDAPKETQMHQCKQIHAIRFQKLMEIKTNINKE